MQIKVRPYQKKRGGKYQRLIKARRTPAMVSPGPKNTGGNCQRLLKARSPPTGKVVSHLRPTARNSTTSLKSGSGRSLAGGVWNVAPRRMERPYMSITLISIRSHAAITPLLCSFPCAIPATQRQTGTANTGKNISRT